MSGRVWLVYRKEMLETLRDRRTLIVMVLLPLCLYPLIAVGVSQWIGVQQAARRERSSTVGLQGARWQRLEQLLARHPRIAVKRVEGEEAIGAGVVDAVLRVPPAAEELIVAGAPVPLEIEYDQTRDDSRQASRRVRDALFELSEELRLARLEELGLPPTFGRALVVERNNIASQEKVGGHVMAGVLPLLVVLMVLLGAFYPAIDLTAGEKERGTLETLLCAPVPRLALILGKYLVVATIAVVTGLLNLGSIGLTFGLGFGPALRHAGIVGSVPWSSVAATAIALVPAALFFAAVMVGVAALARSFKEAQNLLTPVYLVCMVPAMLAQLPGARLGYLTALIPAVNVSLLTRALIGGEPPLGPVVLALLSTLGYALVALTIAARIYNSERMLFSGDLAPSKGERKAWSWRWLVRWGQRSEPSPMEAAAVLLAVMAMVLLVGAPLQAREIVSGLLVTEWLLIALPVLVLLRAGRLAPREVLSLRPSSATTLLGALLAGGSAFYLVGLYVEQLQQRFLPVPQQVIDAMSRLLIDSPRPLALDLAVIALSPAICEELLFRGVLLSACRKTLSPTATVLVNGLLFGLFHFSIYRFVPTALLGAVLALVVLRSGSLLPAVLFHFVNNAAAVILGRAFGAETEIQLSAWTLVAAVVALALGLALALRKPAPTPDPVARE